MGLHGAKSAEGSETAGQRARTEGNPVVLGQPGGELQSQARGMAVLRREKVRHAFSEPVANHGSQQAGALAGSVHHSVRQLWLDRLRNW